MDSREGLPPTAVKENREEIEGRPNCYSDISALKKFTGIAIGIDPLPML
jgi:hypothetical protein